MNTGPYISITDYGVITDRKGVRVEGDYSFYDNSPPPLDEFIQTIALDIPMGCGGLLEGGKVPIANFHFRYDKVDDTHWKLEQLPLPPVPDP